MAQHEEPMDIDSSVCDFDDKENAFQHSNVLPRTPCTEKGYEELDVSELNMKLRYSTTPTLSMSKSYTSNCLDSVNNVVDNERNITSSMNSTVTKNDNVVRQQMSLPLQAIPVEQGHVDTNRNSLRSFDSTVTLDNNVVLTVSTPNEIDENYSPQSSSSSMVHTPETTTPKEEVKDVGSPIMRSLQSVINMFRPSQSPIPPAEENTVSMKTDAFSPPIIISPGSAVEKSETILSSTPLTSQKTKDALTKRNSPNRDSLVFNEDLEKELQWKDETTIIFSTEKIPPHKLFFQTGYFQTKTENTLTDDKNLNKTVEFMDISYNDSINKTIEVHPENLPGKQNEVVVYESDSEFVDCDSTFTKNKSQSDISFKSQETLNETNNVLSLDGNDPIWDSLNNSKETINATMSVKSGDLSIVSTETTKDNITNDDMHKAEDIKESKEDSSQEIKDQKSTQVYSAQSTLSGALNLKHIVPDDVSNVSVTLNQNNTFNIEKDHIDSNAQVDSCTKNNIAIVRGKNENVLNSIAGVSSISQIPLICDPRVLLFNISSADVYNTEITAQENTVAEQKLENDILDTTPGDIPLPDDDDIEKISLEDENNKLEETDPNPQGSNKVEIIMPMSPESASESDLRIEREEMLEVEKTDGYKLELETLDKSQVFNEVERVIESAILAVEHIVEDTKNQDFEPLNIDENPNVTCNHSELNETNIILNAIEDVAYEIASIRQGEVGLTHNKTFEGEFNIVEELQKTIEKLEGNVEYSLTLNETRRQTSIASISESSNTTEVEGISKQNIFTSGDLKLASPVESGTIVVDSPASKPNCTSEAEVVTDLKMHNIVPTESTSFIGEEEIANNLIDQKLHSETVVAESNHVENKVSITQNKVTSILEFSSDLSSTCFANVHNDAMEVDSVKESNLPENEAIITPAEVEVISNQTEDNFITAPFNILTSEHFESANSVQSGTSIVNCPEPVSNDILRSDVTDNQMHNITCTELTPVPAKKETDDNMFDQKLHIDNVVVESNVIVENKDTMTENYTSLISMTGNATIENKDSLEVDLGNESNTTKNEAIITPTDETVVMLEHTAIPNVKVLNSIVTATFPTNLAEEDTEIITISENLNLRGEHGLLETVEHYQNNNEELGSEDKSVHSLSAELKVDETVDMLQTPIPNVNILSSVVTATLLTGLPEEDTEIVILPENLNLHSEHGMHETVELYQNNNEKLDPEEKSVNLLSTELKVDHKDAMDEEIVASRYNSPFVSVSANFEEIPEEEPKGKKEHFENIDRNVETNEEIKILRPSSPKIVSKGYNLNFDDIEDPFATKVKIRMSPPLDVAPNQSFDQTNDNTNKNLPKKKDFNKERRKSQPLRKKPITTNKKLNATFSGSTKHATVPKPEPPVVKSIDPISENLQPTIKSMEVDRTLCESPPHHKHQGVANKVLVNNVEDVVSINVKTVENSKSEYDCVIATPVDGEVRNENKLSTDTNSLATEGINSEDTASNEIIETKSSYNIPEINDTNFNPFASKSKIRQSPPLSLNNSFATKSELQTNQDSSSSANNITDSSKNTDTVNTEDEDTIEGPFLEAEDFGVDNKLFEGETQILISDKKLINVSDQDMLPITGTELPTTEDGGTDAGELYIDADAFEFLLNQNQNNAVADSGRESLFLKFDPLFAKRMSSDGIASALKNVQKRQSTPKKIVPTQSDATFITEAPGQSCLNVTYEQDGHDTTDESIDDLNITVAKPMMAVSPAVNPVVTPRSKVATPVAANRRSLTFTSPAIAVIDRLLSLSANNSAMAPETTIVEASRDQNEADIALTQLRELLADKEINVYTLRSEAKELKDRLSNMESQIKSLENVNDERLKNINKLTEKLNEKTKHNKSMAMVVEEYERTIASLIAEKEQDKKRNAEERIQLIRERDEQTAHLASMEVSFNDLHSKYEKSKQIVLSYKSNEEAYKNSNKEYEVNLRKMQNSYELLKEHAKSKLNHANEELQKITRAHEAEVLKLKALIKRKELHMTSLEETVLQKTKANEELTAICDELINKVSSR